jgi:alpha-tubulin suppressor-like RCC1 family protein
MARRIRLPALTAFVVAVGCGLPPPRSARDGGSFVDGGASGAADGGWGGSSGSDGGSGADGGSGSDGGNGTDGGVDGGTSSGSSLTATSIAAGNEFTCAADLAGSVFCWGEGGSGQLGRPPGYFRSPRPVRVDLPASARFVVAGWYYACALLEGGAVACWGSIAAQGTPTRIAGLPPLLQLTAGADYVCGLDADGQVWCFGANDKGQLGRGPSDLSTTPGKALTAVRFAQLSAGGENTCGLALNHQDIYCWGGGQTTVTFMFTEQIGVRGIAVSPNDLCYVTDTFTECRSSPEYNNLELVIEDPAPTRIVSSAVGDNSCAFFASGSLLCLGANEMGERGVGYRGMSCPGPASSTEVTLGAQGTEAVVGGPWVDVAVGWNHACGIEQGGAVHCWGGNDSGQLGIGEDPFQPSPMHEVPIGPATKVVAGDSHTCALTVDGGVRCWGSNRLLALGIVNWCGSSYYEHYDSSTPLDVGIVGATDLALVGDTSCALVPSSDNFGPDDTICWGQFASFPEDYGLFLREPLPASGRSRICAQSYRRWSGEAGVTVQALVNGFFFDGTKLVGERFATVSVGKSADRHSCGIDYDGKGWCWGANRYGQLGDGTTDDATTPVRVDMPVSVFRAIGVGAGHTCALDDQGRPWCWGAGASLGDGAGGDQSRPVPVLASGAFDDLWVDEEVSCLRSAAGWSCWGGDWLMGGAFTSSTPILVPALAGLRSFTRGLGHFCALDANGRVRCANADDQGQAGDGITLQSSTPRLVLPP